MANDCPICLERMSRADLSYPTLCRCCYNFCLSCVEHMIESSKSSPVKGSDGTRSVKLKLQCPQCRENLEDTLHDTLILRRAETFRKLLGSKDSELTASELRQKHSLGEKKLRNALSAAQSKYDKFELLRKASSDSEEGVEVVDPKETDSIFSGSSPSAKANKEKAKLQIDTTLFNGLHFFMSIEEQKFVVELMTSGDVGKLAQAAQILNGVALISRKGGLENSKIYRRPSDIENLVQTSARRRRYHHSQHTHNTSTYRTSRSNSGAVGRALAMAKTEEDRKEQARIAEMARFRRRYPLPARMPNFISLQLVKFVSPYHSSFPIHFVDDEWDGTIADAFAKVFVNDRKATVTKKKHDNIEGIKNVLSAIDSEDDDNESGIISLPVPRVVISRVRGEAGKQGAQTGDVVTHFNGEIFRGNAEQLRKAIEMYEKMNNNSLLTFVLNAESSTAEALKLRSIVLTLPP